MWKSDWPRAQLLDLQVDCVGEGRLLQALEIAIEKHQPVHIVTMNAEMAFNTLNDNSLKSIINGADVVLPDGIGVVWGLHHNGVNVKRFPGIELVIAILKLAQTKKYRIYLLGSTQNTLDKLHNKLQQDYPELICAGSHHGYFTAKETPQVLANIKESKPDILLVALGVPQQEKWIYEHKQELNVPVKVGVGGSFDVISGRLQRAPLWVQEKNLEWLYRLIKEPSRWRRMIVIPLFVFRVLKNNGTQKNAG